MTRQEEERVTFFVGVAEMMEMECPKIKVFDLYAKSENINGVYNHSRDEIYLKREILTKDVSMGLNTFLHELIHRHTGADDYTREFANGLSMLASKLALRLAHEIGFPIKVKLTDKGFQMPEFFPYHADSLDAIVVVGGSTIIIETAGYRLIAKMDGKFLKPYSTIKPVMFSKGYFYVQVSALLRQQLPSEVYFYVTVCEAEGTLT